MTDSAQAPLVICLGHLVADHTFWVEDIPQPPAKAVARRYSLGVGGLAANAAIAVARLGGQVRFWGRIGDDRNGSTLAAELGSFGVDVSAIRVAPGAPFQLGDSPAPHVRVTVGVVPVESARVVAQALAAASLPALP